MRTLLTVSIDAEHGNKAISDGSFSKITQSVFDKIKPESVYYVANNGERSMMVVFDMKDSSEIPPIAELFFMKLNARIDFKPVMNQEDLQRGFSAWEASQ